MGSREVRSVGFVCNIVVAPSTRGRKLAVAGSSVDSRECSGMVYDMSSIGLLLLDMTKSLLLVKEVCGAISYHSYVVGYSRRLSPIKNSDRVGPMLALFKTENSTRIKTDS